MRTTVIRAALTVGLLGVVEAADAQSGGVRLSGDLSQTFEFRNNLNLSGSGGQIQSLTGVGFRLSSQTPTATVSASTGASLQVGSDGFELTRPKLTLGFNTRTKRTNYDASVTYSQAPIGVNEVLPDLSVLNVDADQTSVSGNFGIKRSLTPTADLSFGLSAGRVEFNPLTPSLSPTTDWGLNGSLSYKLNRRTSAAVNGSLGYFLAENASDTESLSASVTGSLSHQLDSISSFDGNLGLAFIDTTDTVGTATTSAFSVSLLFGAGLTQDLPDGTMGISLNQSVNPSASGSLALGTNLTGSLQRAVNPDVSYSIDASLGRQEDIGGGTVTTFINVSPSYSRQLTRDVSATASYYFQRDNTGSTAQGVTLSFSRPFDVPLK